MPVIDRTQTATSPPSPPAVTRSAWPLRGLLACAVLAAVLAVAVMSGFGGANDETGGETAIEGRGEHEVENHPPRPSGDDAHRPAPVDSSWFEVGTDVVTEAPNPSEGSPQGTGTSPTAPLEGGDRPTRMSLHSGASPEGAGPARAPGGPHADTDRPHAPVPGPSTPNSPDDGGSPEPDDADEAPSPWVPGRQHLHVPARDQARCPMLDMVAIGDLPDDASPDLLIFGPRFRAMAGPEIDRDELVCGGPIHHWRDLVIQRLFIGTEPEGVLAASADGQGEVIRFTFPEWKGYRLTGEDDWPFNLGGRPAHRHLFTDHSIVRTTNGGLVSRRPDTHGFLVINGAWTIWADQNGQATMGQPETQPALSGTLGIYQDFAHGWLQIPGVVNPFEAELLGPDAYVWHSVPDPQADVPPDALGNILEVNDTSWYVSPEGTRHWLPEPRDFACARSEHGARRISVRGWAVATFPIGDPYTCPTG